MPLFLFLKGLKKAECMPTRYLKAGIRDSETIDKLSSAAEVMYYRLLVTVDDFGRYDARPAMLKAACFPIKESVTQKHIDSLLADLVKHGLVHRYSDDGKPYLQMQKWDNVPRAKESKYPTPTDNNVQSCTVVQHLHTDVPLTVTVTETKTKTEKSATAVACPPDVSPEVWADWLLLRRTKRASVTNTVVNGARLEAEKIGWTLDQFLVEWCTRGSQGLKAEWIQEKQKPSFAQQASDVVRSTVPYSQDKALRKVEEDHKTGAPPPAHIREMMRGILGVKNA